VSTLGLRKRLESTLESSRNGPRRGLDRLRTRWLFVVQITVAATLSWEVASLVLDRPYFAPVAAVIALSAAAGQQLLRAIELSLGVALGILVGDLLLSVIGRSGVTVGLVVGLTVAAALLFNAGQIFVNQAGVSAALLATLGPQGQSTFSRFFAALFGVGIALVVGPIFVRRDPMRTVGRTADAVLAKLADVLDEVAVALAEGSQARARAALEHGRTVEGELDAFEDAVAAADEALRLSPPRRRDLPRLEVYADAHEQVDYAVRNVRVLARAAETAAARGIPSDPELCDAVRLLGQAVRALGQDLREPSEDSESRRLAREAATEATAVLDHRSDLASNVIVGQVRSTAADLLRSSGMDTREMRVALGPYPGGEHPPRDAR